MVPRNQLDNKERITIKYVVLFFNEAAVVNVPKSLYLIFNKHHLPIYVKLYILSYQQLPLMLFA